MTHERIRVNRSLAIDRLNNLTHRIDLLDQLRIVEIRRIELQSNRERACDILCLHTLRVGAPRRAHDEFVRRIILCHLEQHNQEITPLLEHPLGFMSTRFRDI